MKTPSSVAVWKAHPFCASVTMQSALPPQVRSEYSAVSFAAMRTSEQ